MIPSGAEKERNRALKSIVRAYNTFEKTEKEAQKLQAKADRQYGKLNELAARLVLDEEVLLFWKNHSVTIRGQEYFVHINGSNERKQVTVMVTKSRLGVNHG